MTNLRERKRERTREEIRQAALALFDRQGFADTTIEQIVEAADVGRRTFFRYFPTKHSVLFADAEEKAAELAGAFAARPDGEHPLHSAVAAVAGLIPVLEAQRPRHLMFAELVAEQGEAMRARQLEIVDRVRRSLADAIAERLGAGVDADPRPGAWAAAVLGCYVAAYERWVAVDPSPPLGELFDAAVAACAFGV